MIAYKVAEECLGKFYSTSYALLAMCSPETPLKYVIGEVTVPVLENSKIFIFDTLENAIRFAKELRKGMCVFECEVSGVSVREAFISPYSSHSALKGYWNDSNFLQNYEYEPILPVPIGTMLAETCKPIRVVWPEEE
jgi:hypothetical protein